VRFQDPEVLDGHATRAGPEIQYPDGPEQRTPWYNVTERSCVEDQEISK